MKKNETLYHLVKSLNKTEKRYITVQISSHKNTTPIHLKLFHILDKMRTYNEQKLKEEYEKLNEKTPLPRVKRYLYHQLKKILLTYQMDNSIYGKILVELHAVEFFYNKNLYELSWDAVVRAKKLALNSEKNEILLDILRWEEILITYLSPKEQHNREEYQATISKVNNEYNTHVLKEKAYEIITSGKTSQTRINALKESRLFEEPLLKNSTLAQSIRAQIHFNNAHFFQNQQLGNYQLAYHAVENNVVLLENSPEFTTYNPRFYTTSLINLIVCQFKILLL